MARARKKPAAGGKGGTFSGILIGLILGLGAAVAVALFVTKVPMPFVDKASRDPASVILPEGRDMPDPNLGLYRPDASNPPPTAIAPLPGLGLPGSSSAAAPGSVAPGPDALGDLIASLPGPAAAPPKPETALPKPPPAPAAPAAKAGDAPAGAKPAAASTTYYLQAGAFRSAGDAEAMKARLLMMGFNASVQSAPLNGSTINRVRLGPFKGIDDMNKARGRLAEEKIETSVVRP